MPLRLKSLELQGYKTFASRTVFEFAPGITTIVGPNGSGKSNIADALRWVLGEQSYSLLRGKKTEDMIFSGSEHRPRAGMAQATIAFDNTEGWLPVDYSEVELSRHAYRDGRNEYLLNSHHVRLREINELLSQAGLSERTYTILGQGLVDASLALKADERRRLFEEAAGVGLYRSRREDAIKRLDATERNLERVLDIISELEPRLRSLERQAKRAIDFGRAQSELKQTLLTWYGYHWHRAGRELKEAQAEVKQQESRVEEARAAHEKTQQEYLAFRERLIGLRAQLNVWHRQAADLHSQREAVSRELAVLEERRRSLSASQQSTQADQERAAREMSLMQERLAEVEAEAAGLQSELDEANAHLAEASQALEARQAEQSSLEEQLVSRREEIEALGRERAESHARLDELKSRIESQQQKLEQYAAAIKTSEAAARKAEQHHKAAHDQRANMDSAFKQAEIKQDTRRQQLETIEVERRSVLEKRALEEGEHSRLGAQLEVLSQAEHSLAGYADGSRFLLDAARQALLSGPRGALSAALDVPAEIETAIAAALGDQLDAVLFEGGEVEEALRLLESDESARAALLPLSALSQTQSLEKSKDPDALGVASDMVNVPDDLRPAVNVLLGQTLIVQDRAAARRLLKNLPRQARIVTLRGEVFHGHGLIIAGKAASSSTLSRPRQKRELEAALSQFVARLNDSNQTAERLTGELAVAQRELAQAEADARQARVRAEEAQEAEQRAGVEAESTRRQLDWQREQQSQLKAEAEQAASMQKSLLETLADVERRAAAAHEEAQGLTGRLAATVIDELQQRVSYWTMRVAVSEGSLKSTLSRKDERARELARLQEQQVELKTRSSETEHASSDLETNRESLRAQETTLQTQIEELRTQIAPAEKDLETAENQETRLQEAESTAQRVLAASEKTLGQLQLDQTRRQEAILNLRQKITDDFGLVEFEYVDDVTGPVPLPFEDMVQQLPVVTELPAELEAQLNKQRGQLRRMGPINPEAKQEYDSESERYTFLKTQVDDLHKAEADLRKVIAELDELTKRAFSQTFEAVDKRFRETFVRLFGGGSARLSLTDPDNLVETGIDIEARLPGRREQGLALLSGGERSLTAIALVFALLKVSPTPVCVMDEVDAMLDEANVGRFRDLLIELSNDTQFIIITHNRNTVQAADIIYGITMGRDSTSQVISLRLDQVTDEMLTTA